MKILRQMRDYRKSSLKEDIILSKKWHVYRWEFFLIIGLAFFVALINQIPNWVVVKDINGNIDPILGYPLRENLIYSSFSVLLTIGVAIFIGIFSEIGKFSGKYGSAIFILVPVFVWLLSDRSDNHIEKILETNKFLGTSIFWVIFGIFALFIIMTFLRQALSAMKPSHRSKIRIEFVFNFINRFNVVLINILIVLTLGYTLVNFGVFTLHLADNSPAAITAAQKAGLGSIGPYNLHSENFTAYIAIIAVVFATLLVVIGMVNVFSSDFAQSNIVSASSVIESHNEENGYESSFKKKSKRRRKWKGKG